VVEKGKKAKHSILHVSAAANYDSTGLGNITIPFDKAEMDFFTHCLEEEDCNADIRGDPLAGLMNELLSDPMMLAIPLEAHPANGLQMDGVNSARSAAAEESEQSIDFEDFMNAFTSRRVGKKSKRLIGRPRGDSSATAFLSVQQSGKISRGPKPKYVFSTPEEAANARRERNRKAALESYYKWVVFKLLLLFSCHVKRNHVNDCAQSLCF
jgi:hypothetical protein